MQYTNLELENLTLQWGIDRKITIKIPLNKAVSNNCNLNRV